MKKVSKLKRMIALVFGFLLSFAPISSMAKAVGNETMTGQAFGNYILQLARERVTSHFWNRFRDNSEEWTRLVIDMAKEHNMNREGSGVQLQRYIITFDDRTEYHALVITEGDRLFVCDYCAVLREFDQYINNNNLADRRARGELNAENLPNLSREWYFMDLNNYIQAKMEVEQKMIVLQAFLPV